MGLLKMFEVAVMRRSSASFIQYFDTSLTQELSWCYLFHLDLHNVKMALRPDSEKCWFELTNSEMNITIIFMKHRFSKNAPRVLFGF
jgi:hypothetical protein